MRTLLVTYRGTKADRFDREHFVNRHLPLAREIGAPLGVLSVEGFFPAGSETDILAITVIVFRDEQAEKDLFAAPRFAELVSDLPKYTNLMPEQSLVPHLTA